MFDKFQIEGDQQLTDALNSRSDLVINSLYERIRKAQRLLADKVRVNLSGDILQVRSGTLLGSVTEQPIEKLGKVVTGEVTVGNENTPYAPVQERGGRRAYKIVPVNRKYLVFQIDGKTIITKLVRRQPLPARYYFGKAVDEVGPEVINAMRGVFE